MIKTSVILAGQKIGRWTVLEDYTTNVFREQCIGNQRRLFHSGKKHVVKIGVQKKVYSLGTYSTIKEAIKTRRKEEELLYTETTENLLSIHTRQGSRPGIRQCNQHDGLERSNTIRGSVTETAAVLMGYGGGSSCKRNRSGAR